MNKSILTVLSLAALAFGLSAADLQQVMVHPPKGTIRALNTNPTGVYAPTNVEAKLNIAVKDGTKSVHFIRDNSDPYIVTKAYLIKNADPYILRGVLKTIVSGMIDGDPVAIESIKYVDGSAVLLISAEEYRFKDIGNGMSIDQIVALLDRKGLPNSTGTTDMAYFPKYNKAAVLLKMMEKSGIGFTGATPESKASTYDENGLHVPQIGYAAVDSQMNALIMSSPGYDMEEALNFLKEVDTPAFEIHLTYKLVEVYAENDQKLGVDFQAWKNNDGIDLFSAGGRYATNWTKNGLTPNNGYTFSQFYNFNPKWNTKYIDFLTTCGKAKVVSTGTLLIADGGVATLTLTDGQFSIIAKDIRKTVTDEVTGETHQEKYTLADVIPSTETTTETPEAKEEGLHTGSFARRINDTVLALMGEHNVREGKTQEVEAVSGNVFAMKVVGDVHNNASNITFDITSCSLIGWDGQGKARLSNSSYATKIQLSSNKQDFVIGGLTKTSVVRSVSGLPLLKDIPVIGWLLSTETDTVKKSQFVIIATAEFVMPDSTLNKEMKEKTKEINSAVDKAAKNPMGTLGFQQLLLDK